MGAAAVEKAQPGMGDEALSRLLFQTEGVRVLAVGPPACLRILYFRAMEKEALSRLRLCPVSRLEYTLGSYAPRVRGMIEELVMTSGTKGVVLYVSCPDLLTQTDYSIAEIAASTGFASQSYFSQIFKKFTGISPNQYRKQNAVHQ